ncbi:hypothetical protein EMCRGX_G027893 [Ephydatia muelleri]
MEAIRDLDPALLPLGFHPFHIAAMRKDPQALKELLDRDYQADVDVLDTNGRTPFLIALQNGRAECAKLLIHRGAKISLGTPAGIAATDLLTRPPGIFLLEELVSEDFPSLPVTPLAQLLPAAAADGNAAMVRSLVAVYGVDVNYSDLMGRTALHYACQSGHLECVKSLLELGVDVHVSDSHFSTPLHLACSSHHLDVAQAVTNSLADPAALSKLLNAQNISGQTPLHTALYGRCFEIVILLLTNYRHLFNLSLSDTNGHSLSGLMLLLRSTNNFIPQNVATRLPCLSQHEATWLLHTALSGHGPYPGRVLVARGASPRATDRGGNGPLHYAAQGSHVDTFAYFLSVPDVDLPAFYTSYQHPLTLALVRALLASLEKNPLLPRPHNWIKWLCLVTPSADQEAYTEFVQLACPSNWVDILADPGRHPSDHCGHDTSTNDQQATLMVYTPGDPYVHPVDLSRMPKRLLNPACHKLHAKQCLKSSSPAHHKPRVSKSSRTRCPRTARCRAPPTCSSNPIRSTAFRSTCNLFQRRTFAKKMPSIFAPPRAPGRAVPPTSHLHPVEEQGSMRLHFVVFPGRWRDQGQLDEPRGWVWSHCLRTDAAGPRGVWQHSPVPPAASEGVQTDWFARLDDSCALRHQPEPSVVKSKKRCRPSMQATWPQWCYFLKIDEYCKTVGLPKLSLEKEGDRVRILDHLLREENLDLNTLIYTAVEYNCQWAVRLILDKGSAHLDGCNALQGVHARKLSESLVGVARAGRWEEVQEVVSQLPPFTIQLAKTLKELLRVALGVREGQDVAQLLLENIVSLLCSVLANWSSLECEERYSFLSLLHTIERHLLAYRTLGPTQRLISFCRSRQHAMDTVVHGLCAMGYSEQVKLLVDSSGPGRALLLQSEDSMQLSPDFYAIYGGHLDVLTVDGLQSPTLLAYIGALLYFSTAPHVHLAAQTQFSTGGRGDSLSSSVRKRYVLHHLGALKSGRCLFSTLYKDPALVDAYLRTVMSDLSGETCSKLLYAQGKPLFHPVLLLCLIPNLEPLHPFLEEIRNCLQDHSVPMEGSGTTEGPYDGLHPLQVVLESAVSLFVKALCSSNDECSQHIYPTVMDLAVSFASAQTRRTGAALLEDILAEYAHSVPLVMAHKAAKRGLWKVVDIASRRIAKLRSFCTLVNKDVAKNYYSALNSALRQGKMEVAASIYDAFLLAMDESECCKEEWGNRLLHLAIKYCLLDHIAALMPGNEHIVLGKRRFSLVEAAAYYGRTEAVQFLLHASSQGAGFQEELFDAAVLCAARQNHSGLLEHLQAHLANVPRGVVHGCVSFWYQVLLGAAEGGHTTLAARAVQAIPLDSWDQLSSHSGYFKILHWCGYWGMHDLFRRIPFAPAHVFVRHDDRWESAWECAVANGHIGELYNKVPGFPCFTEYVETLGNGSLVSVEADLSWSKEAVVDSMLTGWFHRMMVAASTSSPTNPQVSSSDLWCVFERLSSLAGHCGFFYYGCKHAVPSIVDACIATLGRMAGRVLQYMYEEIGVTPLHQVCKRKGSSRVLQALVKTLCDADLSHVASRLNKAGDTPLALASRAGEPENVRSLLQCEPESAVYHTNSYSGDGVLHEAVMGGSCEVTKVLCHALGSNVIEYCFASNKAGISPLELAFALGHHEQAALLIGMIAVGDERLQAPAITDVARDAFGWFSLHMGKNSMETARVQMRISTTYLRKCHTVKETLQEALKAGHSALAMCIVEASAGLAIDDDTVGLAALDPQVMSYMIENHCISERTLKSHAWTFDICTAMRKGRVEDAIRLTEFVYSKGVQLEWKRIFDVAQTSPSVMHCLMQSQLYNVMPPDEHPRAIVVAAASGNLEIALLLYSHICESTYKNYAFQSYEFPHLPPIAALLLSSPPSHAGILRALFHSTIKGGAALSQQWLSHQWTETEVQCVTQLCRGGWAERNPWRIPVSSKSSVELHVEWESFENAMVATTLPKGSRSVMAPYFTEAVVFSPTVLGCLCILLCHTKSIKARRPGWVDSLAHPYIPAPAATKLKCVSSLTLSCIPSPSPSSFEMDTYGHARITLSYVADEGAMLFPSEFEPTAPGTHSWTLCGDHCQKYFQKVEVSIKLDDMLATVDRERCNSFAIPVLKLLGDCHETLIIASKATHWGKILSSIVINIKVDKNNSDFKVSFSQNSLTMDVSVGDNIEDYLRSWLKYLLMEVSACFSEMEMMYLQRTIISFIDTSFVPKIRKLAKCNLREESVKLYALHDNHPNALNTHTQCFFAPYFKHLSKVKHTLKIFCNMVEVLSSHSVYSLVLRNSLCNGINLILDESQYSTLHLQSSTTQLHINPMEMNPKAYIHLYKSILDALIPQAQATDDIGRGHIAPFACYVDPAQSQGLLSPRMNTANTFVIKYADYTNSPLTAVPNGRCMVRVTVVSQSKGPRECFKFGCSDSNWDSSSLLVQWRPRWHGHHKVAVLVNGFHISGSPWDVEVSRNSIWYQAGWIHEEISEGL